jgi:hypothetical protein
LLAATTSIARAQDFATTTEFGVKITSENILDAIQEAQDFWAPVLEYLGSEQFAVADPAMRKQTIEFFTRLHEALYKQLFEGDEASARDLLDYLCTRLRKIVLYQQLRTAMNDDAALVTMMERWERGYREVSSLPAEERAVRVQGLLDMMPREMETLGLSAEARDKAMPLWKLQAQCMARMYVTRAGAIFAKFEQEARGFDRPVGELLRNIATAADWAMITKEGKNASRADFERAWKSLAELRTKRLAHVAPATSER